MYAALLKKNLVLAVKEANLVQEGIKKLNIENYRCPNCQKKVILILSETKVPFFKHVHIIKGEGEKQEHLLAKELMCSSLIAAGYYARTEIPLANQQLRADVLVENNLAFEVQCAPLSQEEFNHRHNLYKAIGVKDIWIVGQRHYLKRSLKKSQKIFLRKSKYWNWYYLEINPFKERITLKYHMHLAPVSNKIFYFQENFQLNELGIKKLFAFKSVVPFSKKVNIKEEQNFLLNQIRLKTKLGVRVAEALYLNHLTLENLPKEIFQSWREPLEENKILAYLRQKNRDVD
ncbi:competence protein [Lactobacillus sp. PV037]|uniref:competence protein CoiA n=1 Tax=Lactobacillus sp. PV037 TaxID=2594496 RepID=UPI00223F6E70|nr:competence protein CoiA family protein [Lactobacillus sp. PV037]QNQ83297.1 competence protein [Lactobacillus sp. PV037]